MRADFRANSAPIFDYETYRILFDAADGSYLITKITFPGPK